MSRLVSRFLIIVALAATVSYPAFAGPNQGVKMALDVQSREGKRSCAPAYTSCDDINTTLEETGYYDVMVVVYEYDNIAAIEYEIDWPDGEGWYFTGFTSCADFLMGGTSGPPLSVVQAWSDPLIADTDTSGVAVGWLKVWSDSSGMVSLEPYWMFDLVRVADSTGVADTVSTYGFAGVGDSTGSDPCSE